MNVLDFHNHLMPAVDDGAQTIDDSCAALTAMAADGVTAVITTPHFDGSATLDEGEAAARLRELDGAWDVLAEHARSHHQGLRLERGVELMLDTPEPNLNDPRLRLAGSSFVLVEFPFMAVPPRSADVLKGLLRQDCQPILAHPERYNGFAPDYSLAQQWKQGGALLQVNGASLLGRYGPDARRYAFGLLERGWVAYLCSDYHSRGIPAIGAYRQLLIDLGAEEHAQILTETNPQRILTGLAPVPAPPLQLKRPLWRRVSDLFQSR